jgi:hypothetical protein
MVMIAAHEMKLPCRGRGESRSLIHTRAICQNRFKPPLLLQPGSLHLIQDIQKLQRSQHLENQARDPHLSVWQTESNGVATKQPMKHV